MADDAFVTEFTTAKAKLLDALLDAIGEYRGILIDGDVRNVQEQLERLAERWRRDAEMTLFEQYDSDFTSLDTLDLLAAVECSLILSRASDEESRALRLDAEELGGRLLLAGREDVLDDSDFEHVLDEMWAEAGRRQARTPGDRPGDWPSIPKRHRRRTRRAAARTARELVDDRRSMELVDLYKELQPDGRELDAADRRRIASYLQWSAVLERRFDMLATEMTAGDWQVWASVMGWFRAARRGLTLAASEDPERRALAMPWDELHARMFVSHRMLQGETRESAVRELREVSQPRPSV